MQPSGPTMTLPAFLVPVEVREAPKYGEGWGREAELGLVKRVRLFSCSFSLAVYYNLSIFKMHKILLR